MSVQLSSVFRKADNIVSRKVMDETLLVPITGELASMDELYALNATSAYIWQSLDGVRTLAEICTMMGQLYDVALPVVEADILEIVTDLFKIGLISDSTEG